MGRNEICEKTCDIVARILGSWYRMATTFTEKSRVSFTSILLKTFGSGVLFMPKIWELYEKQPLWLYDNGTQRRLCYRRNERKPGEPAHPTPNDPAFQEEMHGEFQQALVRISAAKIGSTENTLLLYLQQLYREVTRSAQGGERQTAKHNLAAYDTLCSLISKSLQVIDDPDTAAGCRIMETIVSSSDTYQPFREFATSRKAFNKSQEKLTPLARTSQGLFAFLFFRNVLFNSKYLTTTTVPEEDRIAVFLTPEEFAEHSNSIVEKYEVELQPFFCNKRPFGGQPIHNRSVNNVSKIWKAADATSSAWADLWRDEKSPDFHDIRQFIRNLQRTNPLPGFGPLNQYLVAADICSSGIATMPTPREVANEILDLNAGALSGLCLLKYAESNTDVDSIRDAFQTFYNDVFDILAAKHPARICAWNPIVAEHMLCKAKRLRGLM